ncbi:hypothetical protein [Paraburkholderia oxyphila]|uniref:hypothetical protein n=1 Tax=Paraburkholderia oxyphila TaxID=614212 RepID=UPI0004880B36|nr:hypothetical protein [Paraburkholderia oxyphila]
MSNKKKPPIDPNFDPTVPEEVVEFLAETDMQSLLAKDLSDDILNAVIENRKAHHEMSTREAKLLIAAYRQMRNELAATKERVESVNNEMARLNALYDVSKAEELRLQREMEQTQVEQLKTQEANGCLSNELALVRGSCSALHLEISKTEKERDAARWEVAQMRKRPPKLDDAEARAQLRRINEQFGRKLAELQQLDDRIEALKAEEAAIGVKLREGKAALETRSRVDAQMNALWVDFGEFAQRYHSAQLLCTAEGNPERYQAIFDALADVVGKFHMGIVAASKGRFKIRARRARRRAGTARPR